MSSTTLFDTFPPGVNITALTDGYELHRAATATLRTKAMTSIDSAIPAAMSSQRQALLDIAAKLLISERNKCFDTFAESWIKARSNS